jgi:hypothetical protein
VPQVAVRRDLCCRAILKAQVYEYAGLWHPSNRTTQKRAFINPELSSVGDVVNTTLCRVEPGQLITLVRDYRIDVLRRKSISHVLHKIPNGATRPMTESARVDLWPWPAVA